MKRGFIGLFLVLLGAGCATERLVYEDHPYSEARLFVTRAGEEVTLSWDTKGGMAYTVLYNHTRSARSPWKILPGFDRIPGTGRRLTYQDRVPAGQERYYRLHAFPVMGLRP